MLQELNNKLNLALEYSSQNKKEYHLFGLYTLFAMVLLFILFGTFWNTYTYGMAKMSGTAVSIFKKTTTNDPLKDKSLIVKIPLYFIGTSLVVPFYFLPKLFAEILVESLYKLCDFFANILPNLQKLMEKLFNFVIDILVPLVRRTLKYTFLKMMDLFIFYYKRMVDAFLELKYFYTIAIYVLTLATNYIIYMKDVCYDLLSKITNTCISMWNYLLSLFISK